MGTDEGMLGGRQGLGTAAGTGQASLYGRPGSQSRRPPAVALHTPPLLQDVQLQNAGAWANLTAAPPAGAPAAPPAGQQPGGEEQADDLWTEFQGREAAQKQAEEQKKAAEDEERRKREAEVLEMRRKAEEVEAALKRAEQEREEEARRKVEEQRAREARQFEDMAAAAADDEQKQPDIAMRAGHTSNADLAELGLHAREEEEEEEAMEEDI